MADKAKAIEGEVVKNEIAVLLDEQGVVENNIRSEIVEAFGGPFSQAGEILANFSKNEEGELVLGENAIKITSVDQVEDMKEARTQRLALREARITIENSRKSLKDESLKRAQAIDATARALKEIIEPAEKYLETQEKFAELRAAAQKAERLATRTSAIANFTDPGMYNLNDMEEEAFQQLLIKLEKEAADAAEAERAALAKQEEEAKAERERQLKIQEERDQLQREAKERAAIEERKLDRVNEITRLGMMWNAETQQYEQLDQIVTPADILDLNDVKWRQLISKVQLVFSAAREERDRKNREEQEARDAELAKERAAAEAERVKREELEKAEADRKAAEEKAAAEAREAEQKAAADRLAAEHASLVAPDKEKIKGLVEQLETLKLGLPITRSKEAQEIIANVYDMIEKAEAYINVSVEKL